ncbi:MAG: hypothetical protein GXO66_10785, partial [Euryarchaeota archaeon]|nr:hypothetical protein [Euryarchaeota archaeon]
LSYAALVLIHSVTALIFTPFLLIFALMHEHRRRLLLFLALGMGISSFYWLPALLELRYLNTAPTFHYADHFVYPQQLVEKRWGFGGSVPGPEDGMSFQIGAIHLIFSLVALRNLWRRLTRKYVAFLLLIFLLSTLMTLPLSAPLWKLIPFADFIQFPWRFLAAVAFATSLLSASALLLVEGRSRELLMAALSVLFLVYSLPLLQTFPAPEEEVSLYTYANIQRLGPTTTVGENELLPLWAASFSQLRREPRVQWPLEVTSPGCNVYLMSANLSGGGSLTLPIFYFPGWRVLVNGAEVPVHPDPRGLISFQVPGGAAEIRVEFGSTPLRKLGWLITLLSLLLLASYPPRRRIRRRLSTISGP